MIKAERIDIDRSRHDFRFVKRWFVNRNSGTFHQFVRPRYIGRPVTYLELGVFEGLSMVWMFQYVLTHPDSRAVGIDPWLVTTRLSAEEMEEVGERARHNLSPWTDAGRCKLIRGCSGEVLERMRRGRGWMGIRRKSVDVCMVDGGHNELQVLDDARNCLPLLRTGGWLLFDDVVNAIQKHRHVRQGLDMFLEECGGKVRLAFRHRYVEAFEKL